MLSVDYGAAATAAVLVGPDGAWTPMRFDGADWLLSAVFLNEDGSWVTGAPAWQLGAGAGDRFDSAPIRWLGQDRVGLGGVEVDPVDVVAATLRRVAQAASARLRAAPLGEVRLVVPASWGPRWRTAMREAARRAGLGQPTLVDAPSAAASHLVASGVQLMVGSFLLLCDWGGGFTASVLRRTRYGFEVLSTIEAANAGGLALDQVLAQQLPALATAGARQAPSSPGESIAVWSAARDAREALSQAASVTVALPSAPPVVVTAAGMQADAQPVVTAAADAVRKALDAAQVPPDELAGVFCVGGVAQSPAMVGMLAQATGLAPTVAPDPQRAAVLGSAHATGPGVDTSNVSVPAAPPVPGLRRAGAGLVPGVASLGLMVQFLQSATLSRTPGIGYDPRAYLLADWGELALAALMALVTFLTVATVLAAAIPADNPLDAAGQPAAPTQQIGTALLAACGLGAAVAGLYAVFDAAMLQWSPAPFLRWALIPLLPLIAVITATAALATRYGRIPAQGWDAWLNFPIASVFVTTVGMVLLQEGANGDRVASQEALFNLFARTGGVLIALGVAMVVTRRWRYRLILAGPLAVVAAAVISSATIGVLACLYIAAATAWWARRAWQLANHPHGSLPRPV
ncbi:Hsp70 family protein [Rugosimonospora africana]|uniref:Hsp70 family protein n=1 Tax=Rugosimonospora africana TaxID=556532 RepID=UPI001944952C|nr:Hsp70 family protein [Rugosimonospora africana]